MVKEYLDLEGLGWYTDYLKKYIAKKVETPSGNGLTIGESSGTAYDGAKGKANADFIDGVKKGNKELVRPFIRGKWSVFNAAGTAVTSKDSTSNSLQLENGFQASWTGTFWYPVLKDNQKEPTSVMGKWAELPSGPGVDSSPYSSEKVKENTTISATLLAPKTGLMVSGTDVIPARGSDMQTASASVSFYHRRYFGLSSSANITADVVKILSKTDLNNSRTAKLDGISATDAQYYVIAYPKAMGELTKIVQNGATPLLNGGFVKSEVTVTNEAGAQVLYLVYRTEKPGALKDNSFLEIA